jgi:protein-disulfide isomerase
MSNQAKWPLSFCTYLIGGFDSFPAAVAGQCTNDQGKFWQYHNLLYKNQGPIDSGWANRDNLKKFASQIPGLDMQKFNSCFDSQKYKPLVENDLTLAHSLGFTQTPSFIIVKSLFHNSKYLYINYWCIIKLVAMHYPKL